MRLAGPAASITALAARGRLERPRTMKRMASASDRLLDEAFKLAPDERARIVAELLATLGA